VKPAEKNALKRLLANSQQIVIVTHWSPDGDAIGSSLGLWHYLRKKGHKVNVITPNDYPEFLHWMPGHKQVTDAQRDPAKAARLIAKASLIFCLDFNDLKRINVLGKLVAESLAPKALIDHHPQPDSFARFNLHEVKASSTAELVYEFMTLMGDQKLIDKHIANCLYVGIMTDTGSFRFPATTARTHAVVQRLMEAGAENSLNHNRIYDDNTENRIRLLGYALSEKLVVIPEFRTAFFALSHEEHERFHFQKGDTEGLVNYGLTMRGIVFAAFFAERDGIVKCSFRSKGQFDVNGFARENFSGGGHVNAAGGASQLSLNDTVSKFRKLLPKYLAALNKA
jgi:bifunctional oligoribonuclease and PAP phosphatase NrnA